MGCNRRGFKPDGLELWSATSGSYAVEAAPTVQGPWLPVNDQIPSGAQQMTVPANCNTMFWRLIQAP